LQFHRNIVGIMFPSLTHKAFKIVHFEKEKICKNRIIFVEMYSKKNKGKRNRELLGYVNLKYNSKRGDVSYVQYV